ncbi:hypothetical protein DERF_013409 [Dermatophagoides farinae]|uniref:Uncharacterized protein n=1 Tax=Dermatophagoides farinae TaxID=6954 RepID=A0A922L0I1_DERFA|nr:hypothetical protein DERF_013409 [Dermatophagoides farinae]
MHTGGGGSNGNGNGNGGGGIVLFFPSTSSSSMMIMIIGDKFITFHISFNSIEFDSINQNKSYQVKCLSNLPTDTTTKKY